MAVTEEEICPVCGQPVRNDPHNDCLEEVMRELQGGDNPAPLMPCPACGENMDEGQCHNSKCENHTGSPAL